MLADPAATNLSAILTATAARWPDQEAIVFNGARLTWRALAQQVDNLAAAFIALGIERGDCIGIQCTTRPEYIITYLAAMRCGAILAGFNSQYTPLEVSRLAALARPLVLVLQADAAARLQPFMPSLTSVRHVVIIGADAAEGARFFADLIAQPHPAQAATLAARQAQVQPDDGALMVFTGGVTGMPKGARLSHANIISNIAAQVRHLGFRSSDRLMLHLPMNHVSGAALIAVGALLTGAALVMLERFHPADTLALVAQERVTILGQVPTMWILEFLLPNVREFDLSSLRMTIVAGAPTPPAIMRRIAALAPLAVHGYGLTESAGMVTYTQPADDVDTLIRTAGRAAPEFDVRTVDAAHQALPPGQDGEIAVAGPCVMMGYVQNPADSDTALSADGWLYTGDIGRLDEKGYLTVVGRRKEMFITGGFNVYPAEIEAYLAEHPKVALCACLGKPDPVMGEVGVAFIAPRPGATLTVQEMRVHCRHGLARYKTPAEFRLVDSLPLTIAGKVDKVILAQWV
jgi:fatty-acyl-CoA synthase